MNVPLITQHKGLALSPETPVSDNLELAYDLAIPVET